MSNEKQTLELVVRNLSLRVDKIENAFPAMDFEGHKRAHEAFIERTAEIRRLRMAIVEKTISGLLWAAIVALGAMGWKAVVAYIKHS